MKSGDCRLWRIRGWQNGDDEAHRQAHYQIVQRQNHRLARENHRGKVFIIHLPLGESFKL